MARSGSGHFPRRWGRQPRKGAVIWSLSPELLPNLRGAIAQLEVNLEVRFRGEELEGFFALPGVSQGIQPGQRFFPPFTFLPYNNDVFVQAGCGANLNHPLSRWLIGIIPRLAERYPVPQSAQVGAGRGHSSGVLL